MINIDRYCQNIRKKSEGDLKKLLFNYLETSERQVIEDSFNCGSMLGSFADEIDNMNFLIDFLKKNDIFVKCICDVPLKEGRDFVSKMLNCFNIINLNIDETLVRIKIDSEFYRVRIISNWFFRFLDVITDTREKVKLHCYFTQCKEINNWKQELEPFKYSIICHNNKILWYTINAFHASLDDKPEYFVMKNKKIYGLSFTESSGRAYYGRFLFIYHRLGAFSHKIRLSIGTLDEIMMNKNKKCNPFLKTKTIDLADHFYTGFFYKGLLWDKDWEGPFIDIKIIGFVGNYLKIEITNLTYPHTGYILLDIENNKIMGGEKI